MPHRCVARFTAAPRSGRGGLPPAGPAAARETCILIGHAFTLIGGKFGASTNYFVETMSIWTLLIGAARGRLLEGHGPAKPRHAAWPAAIAAAYPRSEVFAGRRLLLPP